MYAGLRVGEACALVPAQVKKEGNHYWINVDRAFSQDGVSLGSPKTLGKVMVPEWLALEVLAMKKEDYWIKGIPTKRVTTACWSLGTKSVNRDKQKVICINPHMLRHWFATDMVKRNVPANVIMKQMRHKTINTTMQIYAQVNNNDFVDALPNKD
jgi:integrase